MQVQSKNRLVGLTKVKPSCLSGRIILRSKQLSETSDASHAAYFFL
jgi:hypothetical protein